MEVVYLFCEDGNVRIPLYDYDPRVFSLLAARKDGIFDKAKHEFVFARNAHTVPFSRTLSGTPEGNLGPFGPRRRIPCVWVEPDSPVPLRIANFFEHNKATDPLPPCGAHANLKVGYHVESGEFIVRRSRSHFSVNTASPCSVVLPEMLGDHWQAMLETELCARKYSKRTRSLYIYFNRMLCRTLQKTPEEISTDDITQFLAIIEKSREYSASSMNLAISAVKFFFRNILKSDTVKERPRPRQDKRLPMVLSKEEVKKIIDMEPNLKHRLLLMLVYSSGLRVSEVVSLKREHIDLSRHIIYIRQGKGRKDRCTLLSEKVAALIGEYCAVCDIQNLLFPGQTKSCPLSIRSAQHIFEHAIRRAGIPKRASIHSLRHSFATHLLEKGTDITYIRPLLGHTSIKTTERYTHVAKRNILNIKSPFDD